jgi:hypothetical protein
MGRRAVCTYRGNELREAEEHAENRGGLPSRNMSLLRSPENRANRGMKMSQPAQKPRNIVGYRVDPEPGKFCAFAPDDAVSAILTTAMYRVPLNVMLDDGTELVYELKNGHVLDQQA